MKATLGHAAIAFLMLAGPAGAQERQWSLDASADEAFLVFGVPETDDVGLSFWCKIGSGRVAIFYPVTWTDLKDKATVRLRVEIGPAKFDFKGEGTARQEGSSASVEVPLGIDQKLFGAMRQDSHIVLKIRGHRAAYPLRGANIDGLLKLCRPDPAQKSDG